MAALCTACQRDSQSLVLESRFIRPRSVVAGRRRAARLLQGGTNDLDSLRALAVAPDGSIVIATGSDSPTTLS